MSELIDNKTQRVNILKEIIQHLHAGAPAEQVKHQLREIVQQTDATEIMAMEQQLINEGMPVEQIRSMCDLHSQVTREVLIQIKPRTAIEPGHPVDTFRRENAALREVLGTIRAGLDELKAMGDDQDATALVFKLRQAANDLMDIDKHYQRKEHALFSCLERHGITGPSKVMWAKDDEVRAIVKQFGAALHTVHPSALAMKAEITGPAVDVMRAVEEMIFKEENILLPMAMETLTEDEWAEIWAVSPKYGWCLVEPQQGYAPKQAANGETAGVPRDGVVMLPTGNVTVEQLAAVFSALPLDITFVDAEDRVAFFTEGPERIFARSKAIIGRKVQHCHPPRSVDTVDRILNDFRAGREDVAEFWINFHGKFVHIRYFAVRSPKGEYLGTLELTQDLAPLRKLEGERRLLQYDGASAHA